MNNACSTPHIIVNLTGLANVEADIISLIAIDGKNEDRERTSLDICSRYSDISSVVVVNVPIGCGHSCTLKSWDVPFDGDAPL